MFPKTQKATAGRWRERHPHWFYFTYFLKKEGGQVLIFHLGILEKSRHTLGLKYKGRLFLQKGEMDRSLQHLQLSRTSLFFFFLTTAIFLLCFPERENFLFLHSLTRNHERVTEMDQSWFFLFEIKNKNSNGIPGLSLPHVDCYKLENEDL